MFIDTYTESVVLFPKESVTVIIYVPDVVAQMQFVSGKKLSDSPELFNGKVRAGLTWCNWLLSRDQIRSPLFIDPGLATPTTTCQNHFFRIL